MFVMELGFRVLKIINVTLLSNENLLTVKKVPLQIHMLGRFRKHLRNRGKYLV